MDPRIPRAIAKASLAAFALAVVAFFLGMVLGPALGEPRAGWILGAMYLGWGAGIALGLAGVVAFLLVRAERRREATIALAPIAVFLLLVAGFALLLWLLFGLLGG